LGDRNSKNKPVNKPKSHPHAFKIFPEFRRNKKEIKNNIRMKAGKSSKTGFVNERV